MDQIFRDPGSPFFKAVEIIEVESLNRKSFRNFLDRRFRSGDRQVSDSSYEQIFSLAENNPSDVQQICSAIWDCSAVGQTISSNQLELAINRIFATERKGYEALVRPLTDIQMRCLRGLAKFGGDQPQSKKFLTETGIQLPASVRRALDRLIDLELIYGRNANYKFFDPFFRQWILHRFG